MSSFIDDASGGLVVGGVTMSVAFGQIYIRRNLFRKVSSVPGSFPIILKPYRWMIVFSHVICGAFLMLVLFLFILCPGIGAKILVLVCLLSLVVLWFLVLRGARQFLRLDRDGFTYVKGRMRSLEVKASSVASFFAPPIGGNLIIVIKYQPRRVLIPIMFKDINLLHYYLTCWGAENRRREFMQAGNRDRTLYGSGGD